MVQNIVLEKIYINTDKEINVTISKDNVKAKKSEKKFQCEVCNFKCPIEKTLQKHKNTKHNSLNNEKTDRIKFYCHECSVSFKTKKNFKKYEQSHKDRVLIKCSECDYECTSEKDLTNHMNINHMNGSIDESVEAPEFDELIARAAKFNNLKKTSSK